MRLLPLAAAACLASSAFAAEPLSTDNHLASMIHQVNQMEIQMAQLARDKGSSPEVKDYARKLIQDHTTADQELMKIATNMHLKISQPIFGSETEQKLDASQRELMRRLNRDSGPNFDQAFLKGMDQGHRDVLSWARSQERLLSPSDLKNFVDSKLLPSLRQHEQIAMNLQKQFFAKAKRNPPAG